MSTTIRLYLPQDVANVVLSYYSNTHKIRELHRHIIRRSCLVRLKRLIKRRMFFAQLLRVLDN